MRLNIDKSSVINHQKDLFKANGIPKDVQTVVYSAIEWVFSEEGIEKFDNCTFSRELIPGNIDIACAVHDMAYVSGWDGHIANKIFYSMMVMYGVPKWLAKLRFIAVELAWKVYFKKKNNRGNIDTPYFYRKLLKYY